MLRRKTRVGVGFVLNGTANRAGCMSERCRGAAVLLHRRHKFICYHFGNVFILYSDIATDAFQRRSKDAEEIEIELVINCFRLHQAKAYENVVVTLGCYLVLLQNHHHHIYC